MGLRRCRASKLAAREMSAPRSRWAMNNHGPVIGQEDEFEQAYTERFRSLVSPHGIFVKYERDRATLDLGLHLTNARGAQRHVSQTRIWFQLRGIHATTLPADVFDR